MNKEVSKEYPFFYVGVPIACAIITCVVPWWLALILAVVATFFFDSVALVVVAWLISLQKPNPSLLYVAEWLIGAIILYCVIHFIKTRVRK